MKSYEIQGVKLSQGPLKIRQIRDLLKLISDLELPGEKRDIGEINAKEMIDAMLSDKLPEIAEILFGEDSKNVDWEEVAFEEIDGIVQDFFALNPSLVKRLRELFSTFALIPAVG